jgi:hypothetical protein
MAPSARDETGTVDDQERVAGRWGSGPSLHLRLAGTV